MFFNQLEGKFYFISPHKLAALYAICNKSQDATEMRNEMPTKKGKIVETLKFSYGLWPKPPFHHFNLSLIDLQPFP